jgi:hypothetical protein
MKKLIICIILFVSWGSVSFAQKIDTLKLKVISYKEFLEYYLLKTYNNKTLDTILIAAEKDTLISTNGYKKIEIGKEYFFINKTVLLNELPAMPPDHFSITIKNTVVWRGDQDVKLLPVFSLNTKGLYIHEVEK